jgi:glycosyltransferase involved in cell wall biosynthesis
MNEISSFPYSILILTKNEEVNIGRCLSSIPSGVKVSVLDSVSSDNTVGIAESLGANTYLRPFDNYAAQRNYGLNEIPYGTAWVLMLDADERMTFDLHEEIVKELACVLEENTLFRLRRQDMFMGRWLRRSSGYPTWFGRLVKVGFVKVEREINEEFVTSGGVLYLRGHLVHFPFNKGVSYWLERHNSYSSMEAHKLRQERLSGVSWLALFSKDPAVRRKSLKQIAYRIPGRPVLIFLYLYFLRGGLLDGRAGLEYCTLRFFYECMIDAKIREFDLASSEGDVGES